MKNKIYLKKCLLSVLVLSSFIIGVFIIKSTFEYRYQRKIYNEKIDSLLSIIIEKYPEINERDLLEALEHQHDGNNSILKKYGINVDDESAILEIDILYRKYLLLDTLSIGAVIVSVSSLFLIYIIDKEKKLKDVTEIIERINRRDYSLDIDSTTEDELSILKSELYKTTIMLKEQADLSLEDKLKLKSALEDISHQLKTPLTSIVISLDNLIEDEKMDEKTRLEFLTTIKRETTIIHFLVQSLLKMSKLETGTVDFIKKEISVDELVIDSIERLSLLSDLKNISVKKVGNFKVSINCDPLWQKEAITNIIKNAIEHSPNGESVEVHCTENKLYTSIAVINRKESIPKEDIPHIFNRFYRGKNATQDSIGIGLALAKSIVKKDNGTIEVESSKSKGTVFTIKYYKK